MKNEREPVGVKELARLANVSIGTIDRVLHNRPGVAAKTKEKVLAVLAEHNYQPNSIARSLASRKTKRLMVFMPKESPESAYWQFPLQGVEKAAAEIKSYNFVVDIRLFDQNDRHSFVRLAEELMQVDFDGLILAPMFFAESKVLVQRCEEQRIPYVFVNSDIPNLENVAYFGPDLFQSGCMAGQLIKYLLQPEEEILLVHISKEMEMQHHLIRKEEGLLSYMGEQKMSQKLHKLVIRDTNDEVIAEKLNEVLTGSKVRILFVTNSRVASVARYMEEKKLSDILLIGFDFLPDNIGYLKKGVIDFLICHKPIAQGYKSIMALFYLLESNLQPAKINYMPIDVITSENYKYYEN